MTRSNKLANERSLYLKQHQNNPIHWFPWGNEALELARKENKPLFVSIGYSTCHWCHVMAHESFENEGVAQFLNEHFISIKVDREEMPDLDQYFQQAVQMFGRNGGWPLNIFLLPDLRPFFAGTYFPPKASKTMGPSFLEVTRELHRAFHENQKDLIENADKVMAGLLKPMSVDERIPFEGHFPSPQGILEATKEMRDLEIGGTKGAPKFPQFAFLEWGIEQMLEGMVSRENGEYIIKSIENMLLGGINDHARGGIHRYSTDDKWLVPHFEKMLYDQAGLLKLLAKTALVFPSPVVLDTTIKTLEYLDAEMIGDDHYFFSAQDADSEGTEGLYFTFSKEEFEDAINRHDDENETLQKNLESLTKWFGITASGNFDQSLNIISLNPKFKNEYLEPNNWELVRKTLKALFQERKMRLPPHTDNKGIAAHNFMMITALVDLIQYAQLDIITKLATQILNKVLDGVFKTFIQVKNGALHIRHTTTKEETLPYLEDYVSFAESQLRLYEITGNTAFKDNFKQTLDFITEEFLADDRLLTRAKFADNNAPYANLEYAQFDQSHRSLSATYVLLMNRAHTLYLDPHYSEAVAKCEDRMAQIVLRYNPLGAGEALRALTYPKEVYRVVKTPRSFLQEAKFKTFLPYFLSRFVFDYTDETEWQICTQKACELKGQTVEDFMTTLTPKKEG